ncbi:phage tail sheath C-terminal domain-containing protein [Saccharothrix coeruleofusca]|uniref:Tail protein n=1 Tax=Saccharothrix coeruleofusca TaxID=33919 RepID=A0A918EE00_9PSEU|nr:phage tail sheath C-terminal domain-containing protein [Saccharothrix coeruleofusca]MBP2336529.1 phage tail sheath protein FI [Saccharothrix coeruleofusca]GGP52391.1 tail protein [Saccharothrix coeruleofusca]
MPVTPTYPGVYIEELPSRVRTITAVSTSVTAFVGYTSRGPVDQAVTITGFADFERQFGGLAAKSPVSYAVQQFFLNGGSIAVVVRVASGARAASVELPNSSSDVDQPAGTALVIRAKEPGAWGNGLRVSVDYATRTPNETYNLRVGGETFNDVSPDPEHPRYVVDVVNASSDLITAEPPAGTDPRLRPDPVGTVSGAFGAELPAIPDEDLEVKLRGGTETFRTRVQGEPGNLVALGLALEQALRAIPDQPGTRTFGAARVTPMGNRLQVVSGSDDPATVLEFSGAVATALNLNASPNVTAYAVGGEGGQAGEDGGLPGPTDIIGAESAKTGLHALRDVEDVNLLCLPEVCGYPTIDQQIPVLAAAERLCVDKRAFLLVDSPSSWDTLNRARAELPRLDPVRSDHAALYFPHLEQVDPLTGRLRAFPPCGAVAGIMARTDSGRGVWKAPAGTEARLAGTRALTVPLNDPENGLVNPLGVNCLRSFPVIGPVVWGARTLDGADALASQWKYVPVRRLALMIEESLYRGTKWVVFEPNDEPLWAQIRLNVGAFLNSLFERGAFQGVSSREAYFVKCDKETTTQNDINNGIVNILVGFAPLKPAEFVIIQIEQMAGQIEV